MVKTLQFKGSFTNINVIASNYVYHSLKKLIIPVGMPPREMFLNSRKVPPQWWLMLYSSLHRELGSVL
jgi:hypothetical protein